MVSWPLMVLLACVADIGICMNRPVFKIVLTQRGYAQFLQYDVETPPIREFTFCTWFRIYDLEGDQSIFTYVADGNNRIVRLWLDSGGRYLWVSINGKVTSNAAIDVVRDVWRHVCLSYQSDYGAWALYIDSRLVSCEAAQTIFGYILPSGGSVIIGYGTAEDGAPNGLEGEIFGANMILMSTIEKNYTTRLDPGHTQKPFQRNKIKYNKKNINYVVLSDLQTDEIHNNFEKAQLPPFISTTKSYIKFRTPHSVVEHDVGINSSKLPEKADESSEREILDIELTDRFRTTEKHKMNFWNVVNESGQTGKFRIQPKAKVEQSSLGTRDLPTISEYETPPPVVTSSKHFFVDSNQKPESVYTINESLPKVNKNSFNKKLTDELSDVETPPPFDKNTKVYGQWTSSQFAGSVLNYLKSINFQNPSRKRVPPTIPLIKASDNFPYASDFIAKIRPKSQFQRRNLIEKRTSRYKKDPQINVQILEDDLRNNILKMHALTQPKYVEITSRGVNKKSSDHRFYRNVDSQESYENSDSTESEFKPKPFTKSNAKNNLKHSTQMRLKNNNLISILPFLKSVEYFIEDSQRTESQKVANSNDMYSKSLANGNKWHNVKSYSNDYTPRRINMESEQSEAAEKKKHPTIRLKYKHENHKLIETNDDSLILKGRELATEVSDQSNTNKDTVSILKYNHGFLPEHDKKIKINDKIRQSSTLKQKSISKKNSFNEHVKIGNALNERYVIGTDEEEKKRSFVGGNEDIPDINRYRSNWDSINANVPSSLGPRVCKNVELYDRVLYVQPDESIDMTHILSPLRVKNIAIEFILQNYKKCSLEESTLQTNEMLFVDWSKTPVRLFGGAYPKRTTDLCGFF